MTTTPDPVIARHLFDKLAETANKLRHDRVLTDHEIAVAFSAVAVAVSQHAHGPVQTAEWLRDIADHVERAENGLPDSLH